MIGYEQVGQLVPIGHVEVDMTMVEPIRELALEGFALVATNRMQSPYISEAGLAIRSLYGVKFGDPDFVSGTAVDRYVSVADIPGDAPGDWRMSVAYRQHMPDRPKDVKMISYQFEAGDSELVKATKAVRLILDRTELFASAEGIVVQPDERRCQYERPIRPADCTAIDMLLTQSIKRASI